MTTPAANIKMTNIVRSFRVWFSNNFTSPIADTAISYNDVVDMDESGNRQTAGIEVYESQLGNGMGILATFNIYTRRALRDDGGIETDPDGNDAILIGDEVADTMRSSGGVIPMFDYATDVDDPEELNTGIIIQDDRGRRAEAFDIIGPVSDGSFWKFTMRYRLKTYEEFAGGDHI